MKTSHQQYFQIGTDGETITKNYKGMVGASPSRVIILFNWSCCCSVAQLCLTLFEPMNGNLPGFLVLHDLLEFAQTHVH